MLMLLLCTIPAVDKAYASVSVDSVHTAVLGVGNSYAEVSHESIMLNPIALRIRR